MADSDQHALNDIRDQLRRDHDRALAELDALRLESDERCGHARLRELRRAWMIHELAEESVVYRALDHAESGTPSRKRAEERFGEHEFVSGLFGRLAHLRPASAEWRARLAAMREELARHIAAEEGEVFERLARSFDAEGLSELAERFGSAQRKLTMLEQAKAA